MKVIAFLPGSNLEPIVVERDIEQIAFHKIHPWLVDPFDPNPVKLKADKEVLHFTRMNNLTFGYKEGNMLIICCVWKGNFQPFILPEKNARMADIKPHSGTLAHHLTEFIKKGGVSSKAFPTLQNWDFSFSKNHSFQYPQLDETDPACITGYFYGGESIDTSEFPCSMSSSLTWIFEAVPSWNPMIFGQCLREEYYRTSPMVITCVIDGIYYEAFKALLGPIEILEESKGKESFKPKLVCKRDKWFYKFYVREYLLGMSYMDICDFSVNQIVATRPHYIQMTRLGAFDLFQEKPQARVVSRLHAYKHGSYVDQWLTVAIELHNRGIRILPNIMQQDQRESISIGVI